MDRPAFAAYLRKALVPDITPGTVVILDNLATHRNKEATQALRDHGCLFLSLPPYSPDLSQLRLAYSKLKAHLRKIGARAFTEVFQAIGALCDLSDPEERRNSFKAARMSQAGTETLKLNKVKTGQNLGSPPTYRKGTNRCCETHRANDGAGDGKLCTGERCNRRNAAQSGQCDVQACRNRAQALRRMSQDHLR
mmetsp:Transcript_29641/g.58628  ORF Transcript_29641/g.58628 Transcript_29641/m.58628 type:complete len:194 (+) Transcript_29641:170-751(+)